MQRCSCRCRGAVAGSSSEVQMFTGAEVQRCRGGAEVVVQMWCRMVQKWCSMVKLWCRGAKVQRWSNGCAEVVLRGRCADNMQMCRGGQRFLCRCGMEVQ